MAGTIHTTALVKQSMTTAPFSFHSSLIMVVMTIMMMMLLRLLKIALGTRKSPCQQLPVRHYNPLDGLDHAVAEISQYAAKK
jgi:hypothetical protein